MKAYVLGKRYYKYNYTQWKQPALSSNGTMGGDDFAVSASRIGGIPQGGGGDAYLAMHPQTGSYNAYTKGGQPQVTITAYIPIAVVINKVLFTMAWNAGGCYVTFRGSNDNTNWTVLYPQTWLPLGANSLILTNTTPYQYYDLNILTTGGGTNDGIVVSGIQMYVDNTYYESTSADYDFYKYILGLPVMDDKYLAVFI